jgi:ribosomal subunit interface protein
VWITKGYNMAMRISLKATGIELTEEISRYVEKKFQTIDKYTESKGAHIQVEVGRGSAHHKHGQVFRAEAHLSGDGADYYAVKEADDLYAAIDLVRDEVVHELTKVRGRKREVLRRGERTIKNIIKGLPWFK